MGNKTTEGPSELADWQLEDAQKLRSIFERKKQEARDRKERFTQSTFAEQNNLSSANMVWQYLSAHRPLNMQAAASFARGLGVRVEEFSPVLAAQIAKLAPKLEPVHVEATVPRRMLQWVDEDEAELLTHFRATDDQGRATIMVAAEEVPHLSFDELAAHQAKHGRG